MYSREPRLESDIRTNVPDRSERFQLEVCRKYRLRADNSYVSSQKTRTGRSDRRSACCVLERMIKVLLPCCDAVISPRTAYVGEGQTGAAIRR